MKYFYAILIFTLVACGTEPSTDTDGTDNAENAEQAPEDVIAEFTLNANDCDVTWDRFLDQKATKKKVKFMGAMMDVEMGPMQLTMQGEVTPLEGGVTTTNGECSSGNLIFDMTTFKFAEEKGNGLFDTKEYPESELTFNSFEALEGDSVNNYTVSMTLTIQDHSEDIVAPLNVSSNEASTKILGDFVINTLDFPLRDVGEETIVTKDEITVHLDLTYRTEE